MNKIGQITGITIEDGNREVVTEIYPNFTKQSSQLLPPGIDSAPILLDQGVLIMLDGASGKNVQIGVYPIPNAEPGEVRIYSRDSSGTIKSTLNLKPDGTIEVNGNTDNAVSWTDLNLAMQTLVTAINATFATKLNGSGSPGALTLDLSAAKVDEVKLP